MSSRQNRNNEDKDKTAEDIKKERERLNDLQKSRGDSYRSIEKKIKEEQREQALKNVAAREQQNREQQIKERQIREQEIAKRERKYKQRKHTDNDDDFKSNEAQNERFSVQRVIGGGAPEETKEPEAPKVKINKEEFTKTSKVKKDYYAKFPTLSDYANKSLSQNNPQAAQLTNEILSKKPSGDPSQRDTLLHILNGAAAMNGKKCVFTDSSKGIRSDLAESSYLNAVDGSNEESAKFVVTLKNLDQFVDDQKYDKADKVIELKEALANNQNNPIINDIRDKLATAHGVAANRIIINDIYLNGVGVAYRVKDLTEDEKNKIITKTAGMEDKMRKLFNDYDKCAIHPALFESSYDISMFDERGNKTFTSDGKFKVGPKGKEKEYIQPKGWTRYGLKVLGKYSDDKWLHPFQDPGNWYRAYHGTTREAGSSIFKGAFRPGSANAYGVGVYCSPNINTAASYCRCHGGIIELETNKGKKKFLFVFQVAVNPAAMNNPDLIPNYSTSNPHYIAPTGADIRPYGILIKEA